MLFATKDKITLKVKKDPLQENEIFSALEQFNYSDLEQPGRFLSQEVLNHLAHHFPQIYSGSADSARSDGTWFSSNKYNHPCHWRIYGLQ